MKQLAFITAGLLMCASCSAEPKIDAKKETGKEKVAPVKHQFTNKLISETSPYLLQHAHNPVDWFPWGKEAFDKAKKEDKPILLSIGYAACHWCHVMEHESFEDETVAKLLNDNFVCIKVDREERPDIDRIYMNYVQMTTGSGGWPLNVFLTPDLKPFYGGTYFPPRERYGRLSFTQVCTQLAGAWKDKRAQILKHAGKATKAIQQNMDIQSNKTAIDQTVIDNAVNSLSESFDKEEGGFREAPKFPPSQSLLVLLSQYKLKGDKKILKMATHTLDKMAMGGMYDQIGGGFHRYSTDRFWLVPHFEKMLYDNAQLSEAYLDAWLITKNPYYLKIAKETLVLCS